MIDVEQQTKPEALNFFRQSYEALFDNMMSCYFFLVTLLPVIIILLFAPWLLSYLATRIVLGLMICLVWFDYFSELKLIKKNMHENRTKQDFIRNLNNNVKN